MTAESALTIALGFFLLAVSPGPGAFTNMAYGMRFGLRASLWVIAGILTIDVLYFYLSVSSLALLQSQFSHVVRIIKTLGALYLIWVGINLWRTRFNLNPNPKTITGQTSSHTIKQYIAGAMITLANPKPILFFAALLPNAVELGQMRQQDYFMIACMLVCIVGSIQTGYALLAQAGVRKLSPKQSKWIGPSLGTLLCSAGTWLIFQ